MRVGGEVLTRRFAAGCFDAIVLAFGLSIASVTIQKAAGYDESLGLPMATGLVVVLWIVLPLLAVAYYAVLLGYVRGTLGQRAMGMEVTRSSGAHIGLPCAARRVFGGLLASLPFGLGLLWLLGDPNGRSLADHLSGTRLRLRPTNAPAVSPAPVVSAPAAPTETSGTTAPPQPLWVDFERMTMAADECERRGHFLAAAAFHLGVAEHEHDGVRLRHSLWCFVRANAAGRAIAIANRMVASHPDDAEVLAVRALALVAHGSTAEALAVARTAHANDSSSLHALVALARAELAAGDAPRAEAVVRQVLNLQPSVVAMTVFADIAVTRGELRTVADSMAAAVEIEPGNVEAQFALACALRACAGSRQHRQADDLDGCFRAIDAVLQRVPQYGAAGVFLRETAVPKKLAAAVTPRLREHADFERAAAEVAVREQSKRRISSSLRARATTLPTFEGDAGRCWCDTIERAYGVPAVRYVELHLVDDSESGIPGVVFARCPLTGTPFVGTNGGIIDQTGNAALMRVERIPAVVDAGTASTGMYL